MLTKTLVHKHLKGNYRRFYKTFIPDLPAKTSSNWINTCCPLHPEENPSFGVNIKNGIFNCFSSCGSGNTVDFYMKLHNCDEKTAISEIASTFKIDLTGIKPLTFVYKTEEGQAILRLIRGIGDNGSKRIYWEHKHDGKWIPGTGGVNWAPYRWNEILHGGPIWIFEGESCARFAVNHLNLTRATTVYNGDWRTNPELIELFKKRDAFIIPDNDLPGLEKAYTLAKLIEPVVSVVKVIKLPNLKIKQDIVEWITIHNGTQTELMTLADEAPALDEKRIRIELNKLRTIIEMNKELSIHQTGDSLRISREYTHNNGEVKTQQQTDLQRDKFAALYNRKIAYVDYEGKTKFIRAADLWLESPFRRTYIGSRFSPNKSIPGYYNLYKGFTVKPKKGDWALFKNHMRFTICNRNTEYYTYLLQWMARIVQDQGGKRPGVAVVLRGGRGIGKGVFATEFGKLFGDHFKHITNKRYLIGKNNSHQRTTLVMFCDEVTWGGARETSGLLNNIITEDYLFGEDKYIKAFEMPNYQNLIMASNNDWVVYSGLDERRFFILDVSDKHKQDRVHFSKILDQMNNGGREAMMYDLLQVEYDPIKLGYAPKTEALLAQIEASMTTVEKWWLDRLTENSAIDRTRKWFRRVGQTEWAPVMDSKLYDYNIINDHRKKLSGERIIRLMHDDYRRTALDLKDSHVLDSNIFGRRLRELCPAIKASRKKTIEGMRNIKVYDIPSVEICQKLLEKKMNRKYDWPVKQEIILGIPAAD